jgi:hypothetical protein
MMSRTIFLYIIVVDGVAASGVTAGRVAVWERTRDDKQAR